MILRNFILQYDLLRPCSEEQAVLCLAFSLESRGLRQTLIPPVDGAMLLDIWPCGPGAMTPN